MPITNAKGWIADSSVNTGTTNRSHRQKWTTYKRFMNTCPEFDGWTAIQNKGHYRKAKGILLFTTWEFYHNFDSENAVFTMTFTVTLLLRLRYSKKLIELSSEYITIQGSKIQWIVVYLVDRIKQQKEGLERILCNDELRRYFTLFDSSTSCIKFSPKHWKCEELS